MVYSSHALRRISYATCEPSSRLLAFLSREPHSPLYLQHCHAFRTLTSDQAEDLNAIIGNAFKIAYEIQAKQSRSLGHSRSVESLLSDSKDDGIYANLEDISPKQGEFKRLAHDRMSDNTFDRRAVTQLRTVSSLTKFEFFKQNLDF